MPRRPCLTCGTLTDHGSYCAAHQPRPWARRSPSSREVHRPGWNRLRALALQRDGYCCRRCGATERLAVHHVQAVADCGRTVLENLLTLCKSCHDAAHG